MKRKELLKDVLELIQRQKEIELLQDELEKNNLSWNDKHNLEDQLMKAHNSFKKWLEEDV